MNRLLSELYINIKSYNDATWNNTVNCAKNYELTYQDTNAVTSYLNKYMTPTQPNNQIDQLAQSLQVLT